MATFGRYGILYGYFLKVCKSYVYQKVHEELEVPTDGQEMYRYLDEKISVLYECTYKDIIVEKNFPWYIKDRLLNKDKILEEECLDVAMYFKIMELLKIKVPPYLVSQRNYFCHIPVAALQKGMSHSTFKEKLQIMKQDLGGVGIEEKLLTEDEKQIETFIG